MKINFANNLQKMVKYIGKMKYSNPTWEPYFKDIAPILSKLYFMTNSGTIKYIVATMIFKKMSFLEWRNEHWT